MPLQTNRGLFVRLFVFLLIVSISFSVGYVVRTYQALAKISEQTAEESSTPQTEESIQIQSTNKIDSPRITSLINFYETKLPADLASRYLMLEAYASATRQSLDARSEFEELVEILAEQDPYRLYTWVESAQGLNPREQEKIRLAALQMLTVNDPSFALKSVSQISDFFEKKRAYDCVFSTLSAISPEQALEQALKADLSYFNDHLLYDVIEDFTFAYPQYDMEELLQRIPDRLREDGIAAIILSQARIDFYGAQQRALAIEDAHAREFAIAALSAQSLKLEFSETKKFLNSTPASPTKDSALRSLIYDRTDRHTVEEAIELIENFATPQGRWSMLKDMHSQLAIENPEDFEMIVSEWVAPEDRNDFYNTLGWRVRDMDKFDDILPEIKDSGIRSNFLSSYISALGYSRSTEAATLFLKHQHELVDVRSATSIAENIADFDTLAALEFVASIKDSNQQGKALEGALDRWVGHDPDSAWNWLEEQKAANPEDTKVNQALQAKAIRKLSQIEPVKALAFAQSLPGDSPLREKTIREILPEVYLKMPAAAEEYLENLNDSMQADAIYRTVANHTQFRNPARAVRAALMISNDQSRQKTADEVINQLKQSYSEKHIIEMIDDLELSDEDQIFLIEKL